MEPAGFPQSGLCCSTPSTIPLTSIAADSVNRWVPATGSARLAGLAGEQTGRNGEDSRGVVGVEGMLAHQRGPLRPSPWKLL